VARLVEKGLPDKQIATMLGISVKTVEKHVGAVLRKTGSANRTALAHRAALQRTPAR
jgi:DNA-binding NarL/FixJ family response regulator